MKILKYSIVGVVIVVFLGLSVIISSTETSITHMNEIDHTDKAVLVELVRSCYGGNNECYVENLGYGLDDRKKFIIDKWTDQCRQWGKYGYDLCWGVDSEKDGILNSIRDFHLDMEK